MNNDIVDEALRKHVDASRARVTAEANRILWLAQQDRDRLGLGDEPQTMTADLVRLMGGGERLAAFDSIGLALVNAMKVITPEWDVAWVLACDGRSVHEYGSFQYVAETIKAVEAGTVEAQDGRLVFIEKPAPNETPPNV
jgi:hypothetical protein